MCVGVYGDASNTQHNSIKQAYERADAKLYDIAIKKEMKQFEKYKSFTLIKKKNIPKNAEIVPSKFVFTDKTDATNKFIEKKARLVGRGDLEGKFGKEEIETYSPTPSNGAIRAYHANATQRGWCSNQSDVSSAYLHTRMKRKMFMRPPKGFKMVAQSLG